MAGLVFFILGLVNKKQKMFITGLCIFIVGLVSLILGAGIGVLKLSEKIKKESEKNRPCFEQVFENPGDFSNTTGNSPPPAKNSVFGYLLDEDGKDVYCKVEAGELFLSEGICLESLRKTDACNTAGKEILLDLSFGETFTGSLKLSVFNVQSVETGSSTTKVDARTGSVTTVRFQFPKTFLFKNISYCKIEVLKPL